ncbi:MAG TPA: hypothetical protein VI424_02195 [Terriglobales bacterium]
MKAATQAWYWLAAGVLALGLNGYYQDGGLQQIHRLADTALTTIAETRAHVSQATTPAEVTFAEGSRCERSGPPSIVAFSRNIPPQAQARLAHLQERLGEMQATRVQVRLARLQQRIAERDMQRAQVEWQHGRISVVNDEGQVQVELPGGVGVNLPQEPIVDVPQPN